jgi:hypothetical protein
MHINSIARQITFIRTKKRKEKKENRTENFIILRRIYRYVARYTLVVNQRNKRIMYKSNAILETDIFHH